MVHSQVLIISDHVELAETWAPAITQIGVQVAVAACSPVSNGQFDVRQYDLDQYDLLLVDAYMHDVDFTGLCRSLRREFDNVILVLTYERDERHHLQLYEAGVDEAILKPLGIPLFLAKLSVWLSRVTQSYRPGAQLQAADFRLDLNRRRLITAEGKATKLSSLECRLLSLLMSNRGLLLETDLIIDRVWTGYNSDNFGDKTLLKNLIYRLRRKIEPDPSAPRYIHTVNGQGYVFRVDGERD